MSNTLDPAVFRKTLGRFATGIAIVTTCDPAGAPHGLTVNSFTSVSLTPPLVLFCLAKSAQSVDRFFLADFFAINFLTVDQERVSNRFATKIENKFDGVAWQPGQTGAPLLEGALATLDCVKYRTIDAGDHYILLGEVVDAKLTEGEPLLYFASQYRRLAT